MPSKNSKAVAEAAETIAADCLVSRIRLMHRTITAIYDGALRPLGLTAGQLNILVAVTSRGPISPGAVARRLNMEKSTISRNIGRMAKNGWLNVAEAGSGRRQQLTLNAQGEALLMQALPVWKQAQTKARAALGQRGADSIRRIGNSLWSHVGRG